MLRSQRIVEDRIKDTRYVVLYEDDTVTALDHKEIAKSRNIGSAGVFLTNLDGRRVSFRRKGGQIIDKETGSVWNILGVATDGPLAGKRLTPLDARAWNLLRVRVARVPARYSDCRRVPSR